MNCHLRFLNLQGKSRLAIAAASLILVASGVTGALAEGPDAEARNRCAGLGGDFVAVSNAGGCVRIGGHVRAEKTHGASPNYPIELGAPTDGVRHASESFHVRAGAPGGGSDILPR